jgi:uncharacterized protein
MEIALVIAIVASLAAFAFTVVPVVPGSLIVPAGAVIIGFVEGFDEIPWWLWVVQAVLVVASFAIDNGAQALGARKFGASRTAMVGGVIGTFVGPFALGFVLGPLAVIFGGPVGGVIGVLAGEWSHRQKTGAEQLDRKQAMRLGLGSLVIWLLSTVTRLVLVGIQVALLLLVVIR